MLQAAGANARPTLSFEFFPPKLETGIAPMLEVVDRLLGFEPDFVTLTYGAGGSNRERSFKVLELLAPRVPTVSHLTCVGARRADIEQQLSRLETLDLTGILAIRGDPPLDRENALEEGDLKSALELVKLISSISQLEIGVGAFPEKHPESVDFAQDRKVLKLKEEAGACFAITQLFFSAADYVALVSGARAEGISLPIIPGVMPIANANQVLRMAAMSGARVPVKLHEALSEADEATAREIGMRFSIELAKELLTVGAPGIHVYSLNQEAAARELVQAVGAWA